MDGTGREQEGSGGDVTQASDVTDIAMTAAKSEAKRDVTETNAVTHQNGVDKSDQSAIGSEPEGSSGDAEASVDNEHGAKTSRDHSADTTTDEAVNVSANDAPERCSDDLGGNDDSDESVDLENELDISAGRSLDSTAHAPIAITEDDVSESSSDDEPETRPPAASIGGGAPDDTSEARTSNVVDDKSSDIVDVESSDVDLAEPADVMDAESSDVVLAEPADVMDAESSDVVLAESADVMDAKSSHVVLAESADVMDAKSSDVVLVESADVMDAESSDVVLVESADVMDAESSDVVDAGPSMELAHAQDDAARDVTKLTDERDVIRDVIRNESDANDANDTAAYEDEVAVEMTTSPVVASVPPASVDDVAADVVYTLAEDAHDPPSAANRNTRPLSDPVPPEPEAGGSEPQEASQSAHDDAASPEVTSPTIGAPPPDVSGDGGSALSANDWFTTVGAGSTQRVESALQAGSVDINVQDKVSRRCQCAPAVKQSCGQFRFCNSIPIPLPIKAIPLQFRLRYQIPKAIQFQFQFRL